MTKGGMGCALAHRNCYKSILESDHEYTLKLEDDIWFADNFRNKLDSYLKEIPPYDILWLGYHNKSLKENTDKSYDIPDKMLFGLFGYVINKKAASELLNIFPLNHQIDSEIPKIFDKLRVYSLKEPNRLILSMPSSTETEFGTDIQIREDFTNNSNHDLIFVFVFILFIFIINYII